MATSSKGDGESFDLSLSLSLRGEKIVENCKSVSPFPTYFSSRTSRTDTRRFEGMDRENGRGTNELITFICANGIG